MPKLHANPAMKSDDGSGVVVVTPETVQYPSPLTAHPPVVNPTAHSGAGRFGVKTSHPKGTYKDEYTPRSYDPRHTNVGHSCWVGMADEVLMEIGKED